MTGDQLRILREANGLSPRQLARLLGIAGPDGRHRDSSPTRIVQKLEVKPYVPEPLVHVINRLIDEGKLTSKTGRIRGKEVRNGGY